MGEEEQADIKTVKRVCFDNTSTRDYFALDVDKKEIELIHRLYIHHNTPRTMIWRTVVDLALDDPIMAEEDDIVVSRLGNHSGSSHPRQVNVSARHEHVPEVD